MNEYAEQAHQQSRDIDARIREFFDQVNGVLSWVPFGLEHLVSPIQRGMTALADLAREFWDRVGALWDQPGNSERLKQVGEQWVAEVGNVLGDIAGTLGLDKLRTTAEWEGRASRVYRNVIPAQVAGLNSIKDVANQVRTSLAGLANSIDNFWLAIKWAFVVFLVGAIGAIAIACTIVGIPVAIGALATTVSVSLGLIVTAVIALAGHTNTVEMEQAAIRQKVHDLGSTWSTPGAGTISDASVTDGDPSDWRPGS
ncbi:hypothetical protein ABZ816_38740 [Actinosynnema sp. NPDC047251]|uniref:Uncharacterized protein n=1 Tax=Saccharothrix espanaensis (strain ATCC 51144 / DSM 44229 / JCM 9112 / NBRC 15066 / NRRL 15764) TaxID=1179773 RepID=K0JTD4_SACES|nr:hypothetical protein [Saccharothrix espanaensis]CCH29151.1 hypothetical protein BN6_18310 [Saccharothrix espanaensis DSM 44229]